MKELNEELNDKLSNLCSQTEEKFINSCEFVSKDYYYTHCDRCQRNCHDLCDYNFRLLGRCKKKCEECHCTK